MGALGLGGERILLGGLGRRPRVDAPRRSPPASLAASPAVAVMTTADDAAVAVAYADPRGGTRAVRHAALASVELTLHRPGGRSHPRHQPWRL